MNAAAAGVGAGPHVNNNAQAQGGQFQFRGMDALVGGLVGSFLNAPIMGAGVGGFIRSLFQPNAQDMGGAYDAQRATQGGQTFDFGDLKGMWDGLMGNIRQFTAQTGQQQARGEFSQQPSPEDMEGAQQTARPHQGPGVDQQAQTQSTGTNWGKILKWGAIGLGGLTLLNNLPMLGFMGMPFFGAGMGMNPMMMGGMGMGMGGMMGMPGMFW